MAWSALRVRVLGLTFRGVENATYKELDEIGVS